LKGPAFAHALVEARDGLVEIVEVQVLEALTLRLGQVVTCQDLPHVGCHLLAKLAIQEHPADDLFDNLLAHWKLLLSSKIYHP
jgi:hypothetical protein